MINFIKHVLKKYFQILWMRHRFSPAVQVTQRQLFHFYQLNSQTIKLKDTGYRVFSQFEEDGKIIFILATIGVANKSFIEIGSDDGINSNCANLALNFGWHGLFMDGNKRSISRGQYFYIKYPHPYGFKPKFVHAYVNRENINSLITQNGYKGEIDLLSIDIDGNDYWVWDALDQVNPRIVIIETHIIYDGHDIVVPYDPNYIYPGKHPGYHGASPIAMVKLANKKGYKLIGANDLGFNFIFLRNEFVSEKLPEVQIEDVLDHYSLKVEQSFDPFSLGLPFETPA